MSGLGVEMWKGSEALRLVVVVMDCKSVEEYVDGGREGTRPGKNVFGLTVVTAAAAAELKSIRVASDGVGSAEGVRKPLSSSSPAS
jgi:hypothetical protein